MDTAWALCRAQYAGGIGQEGMNNLREFTREGGTLMALNKTASALIPLM